MKLSAILIAIAGTMLIGAAPQQTPAPQPPPDTQASFPSATRMTLSNGVVFVSAPTADSPIAGVQIFLPAGLEQQRADQAGIAALTASIVLRTPVEHGTSLADVAQEAGASISYSVDPLTTRFYLEGQASDIARLVRDLAAALTGPDVSQLAAARPELVNQIDEFAKSPMHAAYDMVRQVRYSGTGFAFPDGGRTAVLARLTGEDIKRFAARSYQGNGTTVAVTGGIASADAAAIGSAFSALPAGMAALPAQAASTSRQAQVVSHRNVASPWLALGYGAPTQFSKDFPVMLVIEALLGQGGDIHSLTFNSEGIDGGEFVGAFYQYDAQPGAFVIFLNGDNNSIDEGLREMQTGISRLRSGGLPAELVARAKKLAIGNYVMSVSSLSDATWLLGRSAMSPDGVDFETALPKRIAAVSAADIMRVAKQYLAKETVALVLPVNGSQ